MITNQPLYQLSYIGTRRKRTLQYYSRIFKNCNTFCEISPAGAIPPDQRNRIAHDAVSALYLICRVG